MEAILTKQNLTIFAVAVLVLGVLYWVMRKPTMGRPMEEMFDGEAVSEEMDKHKPFVDARVGSIMDGPGYEGGQVDGVTQEIVSKIPSNFYFLQDGSPNNDMGIHNNMFSKACCSQQYPVSFKQNFDGAVCGSRQDYVANNYFGSTVFQDSGCLCLSKEQSKHISTRGANGLDYF